MSALDLYGCLALGVAISIALPLIRALLPKPKTTFAEWKANVWTKIRPYVVTAVFSLIVAVLLLAFIGETLTNWREALLAGYTFDSTLQKLATGNTAVE